jgi:hypothetical protein
MYGQELLDESVYEREMGEAYSDEQDRLNNFTDDELLDTVIKEGKVLNIPSFPAYDIAVKITENDWNMTPRQREAVINVLAHYQVFGKQKSD